MGCIVKSKTHTGQKCKFCGNYTLKWKIWEDGFIPNGRCNIPEDKNDGGDNFDGEPHEVSPTNDLKDRERHTDEDKKAEFDLISSFFSILISSLLTSFQCIDFSMTRRLNSISPVLTSSHYVDFLPDYGVGYEKKAYKSNHSKGKSHVANQLSPNNLIKVRFNLHSCTPEVIMQQMV